MAARLSRGLLLQANRRVSASLSSRLPRYNVRNLAPCASRVTQVRPNIARFSHTDASSSANQGATIIDATSFKGSSITEKHWASQDLPTLDALIEPFYIAHFLEFILSGSLPNGKKTELALLHPDESELFMSPRASWAPAPFNTDAPPVVQNMMQRIMSPGEFSGMCQIGHNIHFMKKRLSEGLVPVSPSRWLEKDLNNPDHFTIAHEYLSSVIAVFEYLNIPQVQTNMRDTFNKISGDLQEMQDALNARRKAQDSLAPELSLTALWEEFIRTRYQIMTSTAHSWVLARAAELRERTLDEFSAITPENAEGPEMKLVSQRWSDLLSIVSVADYNIWIPMEGYNGFKTPSDIVGGLYNPDLKKQDKTNKFTEVLYERLAKCIEAQNEAEKVQGPSATQSNAARRERISVSTVVQDELRPSIRGQLSSPQQPIQPWIQLCLQTHAAIMTMPEEQRRNYGFGLAVYRGAHGVSDEQWESLQRNVETNLAAWGDDVQGADKLKPLLKLHWFDSKELGLDKSDIVSAARRHYQEIRSSEEWSHQIPPSAFLIVDPMSARSYDSETPRALQNDKSLLPGDFVSNVLAVDANFDESAAAQANSDGKSASQALEYKGQMRILGNLVWSELYPMLTLNTGELLYLWPHAKDHPQKMYTGPTVPSQVEPWKEISSLQNYMMGNFTEFLKEKDPKLGAKLEELRKKGVVSM